MSRQTAPLEFDPIIKLLHWLTLGLIITVFVLAFAIDRVPHEQKEVVLQLHRSVGLTIWVLTMGRLVWRQFTRFPDWPTTMSKPVRVATNAGEYGLYFLLLLQPLLGLLHTAARGDRVNFFFLGRLPVLMGPDRMLSREFHMFHQTVACMLLALIGAHAATALYHHLWKRDNTLRAMLPSGIAANQPAERRVVSR